MWKPIANCLTLSKVMCKGMVPSVKYVCQHVIRDQPITLIEWEKCGNCGVMKVGPEYFGQSTKRVPCDDCIAKDAWVKDAQGKWIPTN